VPVTEKPAAFLRVSNHDLMRGSHREGADLTPLIRVPLPADVMIEHARSAHSHDGATALHQTGFEFQHGNQS